MRSKPARWLSVAALGAVFTLLGPVSPAASAPSPSAASSAAARGPRPPALDIRAGAMIEASTAHELYARAAGWQLPIASTTKIMTALVTFERTRLGQVFAYPSYYPAASDSQIGLVPGERMSVHDLLIALLLPSADDAAEDLAVGVGRGSVPRFVAMMNAEARRLGLRHTHYATPIGLDTPGNYSTASDLLTLTRYVRDHEPFFRQVVALPAARIRMGPDWRVVRNLNTLVGRVPWVNGVKTGHTNDAGYVLVGSGTRDGMTLISVVLGATSEAARESDTRDLLRYGFASFRLVTPVKTGAVLARPAVAGWAARRAQLVAASSFTGVFPRSTRLRVLVRAPQQLTGPLRPGTTVGSVAVLAGGRPAGTIPLRLLGAVPAPPTGMLEWLGPGGVTLLVLGLLLTAGGLFVTRRRGRRQASPAPSRRPA